MTTLEKLYESLLNSLINAQYESYKTSQNLKGNKDSILPIPYAVIKEVTFNVKYAYSQEPDEIIIDANILKDYPVEEIQHSVIKVDMNNLLVQKEEEKE